MRHYSSDVGYDSVVAASQHQSHLLNVSRLSGRDWHHFVRYRTQRKMFDRAIDNSEVVPVLLHQPKQNESG